MCVMHYYGEAMDAYAYVHMYMYCVWGYVAHLLGFERTTGKKKHIVSAYYTVMAVNSGCIPT